MCYLLMYNYTSLWKCSVEVLTVVSINLLTTSVVHHIETSQLTGFYMMGNIGR